MVRANREVVTARCRRRSSSYRCSVMHQPCPRRYFRNVRERAYGTLERRVACHEEVEYFGRATGCARTVDAFITREVRVTVGPPSPSVTTAPAAPSVPSRRPQNECASMIIDEQGKRFRCPKCVRPRRWYAKQVRDSGGEAILPFGFGGRHRHDRVRDMGGRRTIVRS